MSTNVLQRGSAQTRRQPPTALPVQYRDYTIPQGAIDAEARTVELAFSSEAPVDRWWGIEILDHGAGSVDLGRMQNGAALLVDHNTADQVGVIVRAWIGDDRIGRALVRFSRSARGQEIFQDVQDGVRKLVSVGYRIHDMVLEQSTDNQDTYRINRWEPYEVSLVAVPADASVGVGRSADDTATRQYPISIERVGAQTEERKELAMNQAAAAPAAQPTTAAQPTIDARAVATDAQRAERERVQHILAVGRAHSMEDAARTAVEDGTDAAAFNKSVLDKLVEARKVRPAETTEIGLSEAERSQFSFRKLFLAVLDPHSYERDAGFELEVSKAAQDKRGGGKRDGARTIPVDVLGRGMLDATDAARIAAQELIARAATGRRDLVVGTPNAGGYTVATDLLAGSFIEILRASMVVMGLGTRLLRDLNGNIAIPSQTGGATAYWVAENGAPNESQAVFGQVGLTPKTVGAYTDYSRRLLMQSSIDVEMFVRQDLAQTLALALDYAAIAGTGAGNAPTGILSTAGIGAVAGGANGAAPTYDHIVDLETAVSVANAAVGNLAYLTNAKVRGKLRKTQQFAGTNGVPVWDRDGTLLGYRAEVSNQVPSTLDKGTAVGVCSAVLFGNWSDLLIGMWGGLDLMLDPYTNATSGGRRVVALQDVDVAVRHPQSFAAMVDALTA